MLALDRRAQKIDLVSQLGDVKRVKHEKAPLVLAILITMVALPALGFIPI